MKREIVKYSDDFKLTVIKILEDGTIESIEAARRMFNIKGSSIINRWIKKYGKVEILPKVIVRRMIDEVVYSISTSFDYFVCEICEKKRWERSEMNERRCKEPHSLKKISLCSDIKCELAKIKIITASI